MSIKPSPFSFGNPMPKLLVVDNNSFGAAFLIDRLQPITKLEVHQRSTESAAWALVQNERFEFYFIDLKLDDDNTRNYNGIQLGSRIRQLSTECVIVMYSSDIPEDGPSQFSHYQRCLRAGADDVVNRNSLYNQLPDELERYLDELARKRVEKLSAERPVEFHSGWRTMAARELVGDLALQNLVRRAIPRGESHHVEAIKGGYSGSVLLRVRSRSDDSEKMRNVLKVGRSRSALDDEFKRRPAIGSYTDQISETPYSSPVIYDREWAAMPIREVTNAHELSELLYDRALPASDHPVYQRIVDLLVAAVHETHMTTTRGRKAEPLFKYSFGAELLDVCDTFSVMTAVLSDRDLECVASVRTFIEGALVGHWAPDAATDASLALLHGDFHTRNILVTNQSSVTVIDLARRGFYPRLFDFAAIDVDLVLAHLGARDGADWAFARRDEWEKEVTGAYPYSTTTTWSSTVDPAMYLRSVALSGMVTNVDHISRREYADALVFQFLRHLRFPSVPLPKKLLAVRLVAQLLALSGLL